MASRKPAKWTKTKIEKAKKLLQESKTINEALARIESEFDHKVTQAALRDVFKRYNLGALGSWLQGTTRADSNVDNLVYILGKYATVAEGLREIKEKYGINERTVRRRVKSVKGVFSTLRDFTKREFEPARGHQDQIEKLIGIIKKRVSRKDPITFRALCDRLDLAPSRIESLLTEAAALGYQVGMLDDKITINTKVPAQTSVPKVHIKTHKKTNRIRLGVISDTHAGSRAFMPEELGHFIDMAYSDYGVRTILHAGDMLAGNKVYKGQTAELEVWGFSDQCKLLLDALPKKKDLQYIGILGNHDVDFIKSNGVDPAKIINDKRDDINIIGHIKGTFIIKDFDLEVELGHIKSSAHARSYSLEKHIYRTISKTNNPDVVFCGHRHINGYFEVQGIHSFLVPCFENSNIFTKYHDFSPSVGGIIVDFVLNDEHKIVRCEPSFHLYDCGEEGRDIVVVDDGFDDPKLKD